MGVILEATKSGSRLIQKVTLLIAPVMIATHLQKLALHFN
jgi:hypothetical protein